MIRNKCYITGYLESSTGAAKMFEAVYFNYIEGQLGENVTILPQRVIQFIHNQLQWMDDQINNHTLNVEKRGDLLVKNIDGQDKQIDSETQYWLAVDCVLHWVQGMWHGLEKSGTKLTFDQFIALPYMADLEDILNAYGCDEYIRRVENIRPNLKKAGDCTIVVKDVKDDVYVAHNTHNVYSILLRLFKSTTIQWDDYRSFMNATTMRYSARYGAIGSKDDFYVLNNGRIVMETSILIFNQSLYQEIRYDANPYFVRVTVANWMSNNNNSEWISNFRRYDSGTHVAQWILIDTKKPKYSKGFMNLYDTMMTDSEEFDISNEFKLKGYWGGYNIPYSERILNVCNYDPIEHSYTTDERAVIIKEKIGNVTTPDDVKHLIRLNENSTYPCGSIAPRCDLDPRTSLKREFGAIDAKYTQASWIKAGNLTVDGVVAPSFENKDFTPFEFNKEWSRVPHRETPLNYNYGWNNLFKNIESSNWESVTNGESQK